MVKHLIRKVGIIFGILVVCAGAIAGYCDTKFTTEANVKEIARIDKRVDKNFDKIEVKLDELNREQTLIKVQNAAIFEMVKFLKEKAE